jgi:hypothetical protein
MEGRAGAGSGANRTRGTRKSVRAEVDQAAGRDERTSELVEPLMAVRLDDASPAAYWRCWCCWCSTRRLPE